MTKQELHQAFLNTFFKVFGKTDFTIKIDAIISEAQQFNTWAFITAWNPLPVILSLEENRNRKQNLVEELISFGFK